MSLPLTQVAPTVRVQIAGGNQTVVLGDSPQVLVTNLSGALVFLRFGDDPASEADIPVADGTVQVFGRRAPACSVWAASAAGDFWLTPVEGE